MSRMLAALETRIPVSINRRMIAVSPSRGQVATVARLQQAPELVVGQHRRLVGELGWLHADHGALFEFAFGEAPLEERLEAAVAVQRGSRLPAPRLVGDEV